MNTPEAEQNPLHRWRTPDGVVIAGDSWGASHEQLVVMLHGGGQTRHAWQHAGQVIAEAGYHTVAVDARGHGDSDWSPDGSYETDRMVSDLVAVVRHIDKPKPVLVGASMGGAVSLIAAGEGWVDVGALILVDSVPRNEPAGGERVREFMRLGQNGFDSLDEVAAAIASYQPHRRRRYNSTGLLKNVRLGSDGRYWWHWDPKFLERRIDRSERIHRLERALEHLVAPSLLVHGGLSDVVGADGISAFRAISPATEYIQVSNAAHMVAGDDNDQFIGAVLEFLGRVVPAMTS